MVRKRQGTVPTPEVEPVPARVLDANQVVAYNFGAARVLRGWTQDEAARYLAPHLGQVLPKASISAIERSVESGRTRLFNAQELVAFSLTFDLPIGWFFLPPPAASDYTLAGTDQNLSVLVSLLFGRTNQLDAMKKRLEAMRERSGEEVTGEALAAASDFPPDLSWEHFSRTREEALLALVDTESSEIERLLGELGRVMESFERFSLKTFMANHPRDVYRDISHSLVGEKVFSQVISELDRGDPGRYGQLVAAMGTGKALEDAFDLDDAELVERLGAVFDRVEENLGRTRKRSSTR